MGIPDDVRAEFAHLGTSVVVSEEAIAAVEKELEALSPEKLGACLQAIGYAVNQKRQAASAIAVARQVAGIVARFLIAA